METKYIVEFGEGKNKFWLKEGDGVPCQMDRLAALGNSVKPQIAQYLFECIKIHYKKVLEI